MAIRYGRGDVKQTTTGFRGPLMVQSLTSAKSKFLSLLAGASVALALIIPSSLCAATLQEILRFADNIGTQAGKQYCSNKAYQEAMEKGAFIALGETNIPFEVISEIDFEDTQYAVAKFVGMLSYAIDNCPERAKILLHSFFKSALRNY